MPPSAPPPPSSLQNIQDQYAETCNFVPLRFTAATFGALTAPLFFLIMRAWGGSVRAAVFAACLFMFDNLNLIESRLILVDSQLIFWVAAALLVGLRWWSALNEDLTSELTGEGPRLSVADRAVWCVLVGVCCANAFSVKWTGLATPGLIAVESFTAVFFLKRAVPWLDLLGVAGVAFCTYGA